MLARIAAASLFASLAVAAPSARAERLPEDTYLDDDGDLRPFRETYQLNAKPGRREPKYFRAGLEQLIVLGAGTAYYWIRPEINKQDWDFPDYATRMSNLQPTFDTNLFSTNHLLHPAAGAAYYGFARINGLSIPVALGYSFASSAVFEFLLEWLEKASINDLVFTPMGGFAAGEFFVHMSEYFNAAPKRMPHQHVGGVVFGWPHHLHGIANSPSTLPADRLGFSSLYWHRFDALFGGVYLQNDKGGHDFLTELTLGAKFVSIPGFLRPGRFTHHFSDGEFTEAKANFVIGDSKQFVGGVMFDANLAGKYSQDIYISEYGKPVGRASMIAINSAMRFLDRRPLRRHDAYAMAHLIGPAFKLWGVHGDFTALLEGATHVDFASIQALPYEQYKLQFGAEGTKSVLQDQGYMFALGWSGWLRGTLQLGGFEVSARAFLGTYGSIDRWDRFQEKVTKNPHHTDKVAELEGYIAMKLPRTPAQVRLYTEHIGRESNMPPLTVRRWDRRYGLAIGLRF